MDPAVAKGIAFAIFGVLFKFYTSCGIFLSLLAVLALYAVTGGWRFIYIVIVTIPRDLKGLMFLLDVYPKMRKYQKNNDDAVSLFQQNVKKHPDKVAMVTVDERSWTYREVDEYSNRVANYFYEQGFRKGDVVAIFMESRPEFVMMWLGLAKIGCVSALINFNLRLETLYHCIEVSKSRALIFGSELAQAVHDIRPKLPANTALYYQGSDVVDNLPSQPLDAALSKASTLPPPKDHKVAFNDKLFYVYTSGTTGLPKAAIIIHSRFFYMSHSIFYFFDLRHDDVIYDCLPLYHTAGGILGVGNCLLKGCTLVIRKKFSATRYWDDCIKYNCTVGQYIGEICRYLLAQPSKPQDRQHKVRVMFGNGIRPQIWTEFKERFNIQRIGELYGATEGNANIINPDNTPGAIGFNTRLLPWIYPVQLIKVDQASGELLRNKNGLCMRCGPGEPGELVGKIVAGNPMREFDGYASAEATKKKIGYDIFKKGDKYFLTGDILEMDEYGYMYFRDRTGDTFRWKGENVSTSEVEAVVSSVIQLNDAVVYGVEIPGTEGRAGMAVIVDELHQADLKKLYQELQKSLPVYARPVFLRYVEKLEMTGTFKLKKVDYQKEGFNPNVIKDKLYYLDSKLGQYSLLDKQAYENINSGQIRF